MRNGFLECVAKRLVLGAFGTAAVVCGGSKHPQGVPNAPTVEAIAPNRPDDVLATKDAKSTKEDVPLRSLWSLWPSNWNTRGAWRDSFRLNFADGWVFPWGSNHLAGVEVISQGAVWPVWNDTNAIARLGVPVSIVPGLTTFGIERHDEAGRDSYEFRWDDATVGRIAPNAPQYELMTASIELFRSGDWCVTTNGAARWGQRALPFPHDGYGQDAEWVAANFTNATEILQQGYVAWVDAQVGEGLTNGLYKLMVGVTEDPPETTLVTVGDYSVAVTNAGEHVFLLEKGPDYALTVFPPNTNIILSAVDDVPIGISPQINTNRHKLEEEDLCGFVQICGQENPSTRGWIADGGAFGTDYAPGRATGRVWWLPWLCGSPDVPHLYPDGSGVTLEALLADYCWTGGASFHWTAAPGLAFSAPDARTTEVTATNAPSWAAAHLSVTATFGGNHALTSYTDGLTYGTNDAPQVSCSLAVQDVLFVNEGGRTERVYPVSVALACPVPTNGVVNIEHTGSDGARFWRDAEATEPLTTLTGIPVSSVIDASGAASYSFYMTSPQVGGGRLEAMFALPGGDTRGVAKGYRVIEPLRQLVTTARDAETGLVVNPSRLVYGSPARLKVGCNGGFSPEEVEWRVVSGPGIVARDEDEFEDAGWTATVEATADSGEVVVEARFNGDAVQPRFVLPVVKPRTIPVRAFVVKAPEGETAVSNDEIEDKLDYANLIYRQVGITFNLVSITRDVGTTNDWMLAEYDHMTNATNHQVHWRISQQALDLMNFYTSNDCIEVYFVGRITHGHAAAFRIAEGIALGKTATRHVLAHELGHALGLRDCYAYRQSGGGSAFWIDGGGQSISANAFLNQANDWGMETKRGFYPAEDTLAVVLRRCLMYGVDEQDSIDIPSGLILSLRRNAASSTQTDFVRVGADYIEQDNGKVYSK